MAALAPCLDPDIARQMPGAFLLLPAMTRLALAAGDAGTAVAAAAAASQEAAREPLPRKTAIADHCRGLVSGDPGPALAAADYHAHAGRPLDAAQAREDAAVLAAAAGDLEAARQGLTEAVALYAGLGASWDIGRAAGRLAPYGVRRGRAGYRRRPTTGWRALTPTEARVAQLVATGMSNPDIAARLFLSRNTVQTHVSHILAKIGAGSRAEIIRQAAAATTDSQPPVRRGGASRRSGTPTMTAG